MHLQSKFRRGKIPRKRRVPVEGQAAELDYRFKVHARRVDGVLDAIDEVKSRLASTGGVANE